MILKHLIVFLLIVCCSLAAEVEKPKLKDFKKFKLKYGISYSSREEESKRFKIWKSNFKFVQWHNQQASLGEFTYTLEMNEFGDMVRSLVTT